TPATLRRERAAGSEHPRHLTRADLARFLNEKFGFGKDGVDRLGRLIDTKYVLLPSVAGRPLPSFELAPYLEDEIPAEYELVPWQIYCFPLGSIISELNDIQFVGQSAAEEFQLGI